MPNNLRNRISKLETIKSPKVSGIIIYFKTAKHMMILANDLKVNANSYEYICFLPIKEKG